MLNSQGIPALTPEIDVTRFLQDAERLFAADAWLQEAIQNSLRAGATRLQFLQRGHDLIIADNGRGLQIADWAVALHISRSGWGDDIARQQRPAGMGLFSILLSFDTVLESRGIRLETTPEAIKARAEFHPVDCLPEPGTRLTLGGGWARFTPLITERGELNHDRLGQVFGAALFNCHRQRVHLQIPSFGIDTDIATADWCPRVFDPEASVPYPVQTEEIDPHTQTIRKVNVPLLPPKRTTDDYYLTLTHNLHSRGTLQSFPLIFHGRFVTARLTDPTLLEEAARILPVITVYGQAPFSVRHPDRTHVREDEAWTLFQQQVILPLVREWNQQLAAYTNPPGHVPLNIYGRDFARPGERFYFNELDAGTTSCRETAVSAVLSTQPEMVSQFRNSRWLVEPAIYQRLDFVTDLILGNTDTYPADHQLEVVEGQVARMLEQLALEGQICFGQVRGKPWYQRDRVEVVERDEFHVTFGAHRETLEFQPKQGAHRIAIYDSIGIRLKGRHWTIQQPFIVADIQPHYVPDFEGVHFYANGAYQELLRTNPKEAARLFFIAADDTFFEIERDSEHEGYSGGDYSDTDPFKRARTFFEAPNPRADLVAAISRYLSGINKDWHRVSCGGRVHLKHLRIDKHRLELRATAENRNQCIKVAIDDSVPVFELVERQKIT